MASLRLGARMIRRNGGRSGERRKDRSQMSEVRCQKSEDGKDRGQGSEGRCQRTEEWTSYSTPME